MSSLANRLVVVFFKMVNLQTTDRDWRGRVEKLVFHRIVYSVKRPITFSVLGFSKQAVEYVTFATRLVTFSKEDVQIGWRGKVSC